ASATSRAITLTGDDRRDDRRGWLAWVGSILAVVVRGRVCVGVVCGVLVAGCGAGGTIHRRPMHPEVFSNQHVVWLDRFLPRTVDGDRYLVPAGLSQAAIDFVHPESVNVRADPPFPPRTTPPGIDASTGATIERPSHVEVIATGPSGRPVDISWE